MDYNEMTSSQLVEAYNAMAATDIGQAVKLRPVNKFSDHATGVARCEKAASSIRAWQQGQQEEDARPRAARPAVGAKDKEIKVASKKTETVADGDAPVVRKGTNRDKVMSILLKGEGKFFKLSTLAEKLYGDAERTGPLGMVLKGIGDVIAKKNLGVELRKEKDGREVSVGLFRA